MEKVIIIRYCELYLKGKNRGFFERIFAINIEKALKGIKHELHRQSGRYLLEGFSVDDISLILSKLNKVFGIHTLSVAYKVPSELKTIFEVAELVCPSSGTFKVETHRADKKFPLNSMQISAELGGMLLDYYKDLSVDIHEPQFVVNVDVRENGTTLGKGLTAYNARDARLIAGRHSDEIEALLGYHGQEEIVHRDDMVTEKRG